MSPNITISRQDIYYQAKLSCQIPSLIEAIATRKIIFSTAKEMEISVETEEIQQAADRFRLSNQLQNSQETWAWLQKHDLTVDDFEELIYTTLVANKLAQNLFANQVEPYFVEHQLDYAGAIIYEVILDDEDLATEFLYAIREGEISFFDVARQHSRDIESKRKSGYRGFVRRQDLKPEISAAVFVARPPQVLEPIVTSSGIHLIMVEEIMLPELDEKLRWEIVFHLFSEWLTQQIEQVEIFVAA
jgi:parvulin-like peptidyl-prolyl isomerase